MQYVVLFLAIVLLGVALVVGFRPRKVVPRRAEGGAAMLGLYEPEPVLPPVLLPERPTAADIDALRLSPALRGYRCDQVDGVLDALSAEVERLHAEIEELRAPRELSELEEAELLATWGPEGAEGSEGEAPAAETNAEPDAGEAPERPEEVRLPGPDEAADTALGVSAEAPAEAGSEPKEGPFGERSQTFRSV